MLFMMIRESHLVPEGIHDVRLSRYARSVFTALPSRKGTDKAIKRGELRIDGDPAGTGDWIKPGQLLELVDLQQRNPKPYRLPLEVVLEDEFLAVVNKPAGIEVSGNKFKTVENALGETLTASALPDALPWPRPVHRLDYSTSGLLIAAKTAAAQVSLGQQFEERKIHKRYCAVVTGRPPASGQIDEPISGLPAQSRYSTIESVPSLRNGQVSLVHLFPVTGRTHQLRIHMADIGHPIMGDHKYGPQDHVLKGKGLFLAAVELRFIHPATGKEVTITIDPPPKFAALLQREQRRWNKYNTGPASP